jgi:hypothetical protein
MQTGVSGNRPNVTAPPKPAFKSVGIFSCGSGFPAATIEAESLSHKKQNLLADNVTLGAMPR